MKLFDPPCRNTEICPPWKSCLECEWRVCVSSTDALVIIIINNECHSNIIVDRLQGTINLLTVCIHLGNSNRIVNKLIHIFLCDEVYCTSAM